MYAICSTIKDDVAKCVEEMVRKKVKGPVIQFGVEKYKKLEKTTAVKTICDKIIRGAKHVINFNTMRIHVKGCRMCGKNTTSARLINIEATGLPTCGHCMK